MKTFFTQPSAFVLLLLFAIVSCNKKSETTATGKPEKEISQEQEARVMKGKNGDSISVVYFAEGDEVAVRIKQGNQEHKLSAKGSNERGEPTFTDGNYAWEMTENGTAGRLTKKGDSAQTYRQ